MQYQVTLFREKDSHNDHVMTATIYAHDDAEAFESARDWASGHHLPIGEGVWLMVKSPDNRVKTFRASYARHQPHANKRGHEAWTK